MRFLCRFDSCVMPAQTFANHYIQYEPSMTSCVDPYPFIESIHTLHKRVWIDSIEEYGSTQDTIDGPHWRGQILELPFEILFKKRLKKNHCTVYLVCIIAVPLPLIGLSKQSWHHLWFGCPKKEVKYTRIHQNTHSYEVTYDFNHKI